MQCWVCGTAVYGPGSAATAAKTAWRRSVVSRASGTTMFVTEPLVGSVLGIVVLGETIHTSALGYIALGVAVVVTVVATAALAHGQAARSQAGGARTRNQTTVE